MAYSDLIPEFHNGKENDLHYTIVLSTKDEALVCFTRACFRLRNPSIWHELMHCSGPSFQLLSSSGAAPNRLAEVNDYFRIYMPVIEGNQNAAYDWVKVATIEEQPDQYGDKECFAIKLAVCDSPDGYTEDTAHLHENGAITILVIERDSNDVTASYFARNIFIDTHSYESTGSIPHAVIEAGGFIDIAESVWHDLLAGLLADEIGGANM